MIFSISQTLLTAIRIIQNYISHYLVKFYYGKKKEKVFLCIFNENKFHKNQNQHNIKLN